MNIDIYNNDCLQQMDEFIASGRKFDLIIADLPYGQTNCRWDTPLPFDEVWECLDRLSNDNTAILLFGQEPFASQLRMSRPDIYRYDLYWVKERPVNFFQLKRRPGKTVETISVFYKTQPTYNPQKTIHTGRPVKNSTTKSHNSITSGVGKQITPYHDDGTRYPTDVLRFNREPLRKLVHPTQKPVALLEYLIKTYSNEGDEVLDFVMGSGSTGVACQNTNRNFTGIEIDIEYFNIAKQRLNCD